LKELAGKPVTAVKDYLTGIDGLPVSNVLVYEAEGIKAIVRPSGTEPKVKVYLFAKAADQNGSTELLNTLEQEISAVIK
ncbi:MAG: phospho-sugar mutase, partial [Clostridia bacterium]|nr:phospho-sugar mutase [Clostridia bacterium]